MSHQDMDNKTAIVTGGASGMGRETAKLFARRGANVVVGDINLDGAEDTARSIRDAGGRAMAAHADLTKSADVQRLVQTAIDAFKRLDFAANVAGYSSREGGIANCSEDDWAFIIATNLTSTYLCLKYQSKAMQSGGAIVNFSSIGGLIGSSDQPAYVAAKHGVLGLTKSTALEFGPKGIRVNAICPGFTRTPMTQGYFGEKLDELGKKSNPLGKVAEPQELAETAVWLCSPAASFVNGATLTVDGGTLAGIGL